MLFKVLILSIILVGIVMLALGIKLLTNPKAEFSGHTCAFDFQENLENQNACAKCKLKDLSDCPEQRTIS